MHCIACCENDNVAHVHRILESARARLQASPYPPLRCSFVTIPTAY